MINNVSIGTFITWFINEVVRIGTYVIGWLDNINIYNNVTLLDFIVTLMIIEAFIGIILTLPQVANKHEARYERRAAKNNDK